MEPVERSASDSAVDVHLPADARVIPDARHAIRRWMLRRDLREGRSLVEFVASELLADAVTHATGNLDLRIDESDGGVVRLEVRGPMGSGPQHFGVVAAHVSRRREALLHALCADHGRSNHGGMVTLWAEVRADRRGL